MKEARAPSNIQFENRDYTLSSRVPRLLLLILLLLASFVATAASISSLRGIAAKANRKYMSNNISCGAMIERYSDKEEKFAQEAAN